MMEKRSPPLRKWLHEQIYQLATTIVELQDDSDELITVERAKAQIEILTDIINLLENRHRY